MNFAFAGTLVLVVAPTLSRAGISMFVFIVHSPLTKASFDASNFTPPEECPLDFHAFQRELAFDLDKEFILDGLQNGFKPVKEPDASGIAGYDEVNYASATCAEFKPELDGPFAKELGLGRISRFLVKPKCIHAIGRVPRKDSGKSPILLTAVARGETPSMITLNLV